MAPDLAGRADRISGQLATRTRQLLNGDSLWTAGVAGLGIALPSVDYLAVLALIVASGTAAAVQVGALLMFNVVAFGFVEVPLISYLVAPDRTRATLSALQDWLRSRRRASGRPSCWPRSAACCSARDWPVYSRSRLVSGLPVTQPGW